MKTYESVVELHLNLENIISESRDVAQALNEFADNLEQIKNKYAEPQQNTEEEEEVKEAIVARPKCIFCEYATLKVTDPPCDPCFCTANRPNFKPNESCKKLYSKIKEGIEKESKPKYMTEEAYKEWREEMNESNSNNP